MEISSNLLRNPSDRGKRAFPPSKPRESDDKKHDFEVDGWNSRASFSARLKASHGCDGGPNGSLGQGSSQPQN